MLFSVFFSSFRSSFRGHLPLSIKIVSFFGFRPSSRLCVFLSFCLFRPSPSVPKPSHPFLQPVSGLRIHSPTRSYHLPSFPSLLFSLIPHNHGEINNSQAHVHHPHHHARHLSLHPQCSRGNVWRCNSVQYLRAEQGVWVVPGCRNPEVRGGECEWDDGAGHHVCHMAVFRLSGGLCYSWISCESFCMYISIFHYTRTRVLDNIIIIFST